MGLKRLSTSVYDKELARPAPHPISTHLPSPDPYHYKIGRHLSFPNDSGGNHLLIEITYPDCTNYEGKKILVYRNVTVLELLKQVSIDPHFSNNDTKHSPIARFMTNKEGWQMARMFCVLQKTLS